MRKRKENIKLVKKYLTPYLDGVESAKSRISSSRFLLSYNLSTNYDYLLPQKLIPTISSLNDSFWKDWYLSKLNKLKLPSNREVKVHVYWLNGNLRCEWSIKPRVRLYLRQLNLYFEDYDEQSNEKCIYICEPSIISKNIYVRDIEVNTPTRPKSNKTLNKFRGTHLFLTYSKLPSEFVDSIFLNDNGGNKSVNEVKDFLRGINGWDKHLSFELNSFIICCEKHKDGTTHLHIYVNLSLSPCTINVNAFDIWTGNYWSRPSIQSSKFIPIKEINYVLKDGNFIADSSLIIVNIPGIGFNYFTAELYVRHIAGTINVEQARQVYEKIDYEGYLLKWTKLKPKLEKLRESYLKKFMEYK